MIKTETEPETVPAGQIEVTFGVDLSRGNKTFSDLPISENRRGRDRCTTRTLFYRPAEQHDHSFHDI